MPHPRRLTSALSATVLLLAPVLLFAQMPTDDSNFLFPPGITGTDARVFIGLQRGVILYATPAATNPVDTDSVMVTDSATPGGRLPAEVAAIWYLAMPDRTNLPQLVTGLVSYRDGATQRYGFIRSTDLGETWTLVKSSALAHPSFVVSNDYWSWQTLSRMTWLPDGVNGWIYGDKGIVSTSDGGDTWRIRFNQGADAYTAGDGKSLHVNALAFKDATTGVAALGWTLTPRLYLTVDGGDTLYPKTGAYAFRPWVQLDWVGGEFRGLQFDRAALNDQGITTYFWSSSDGSFWDIVQVSPVRREQTYHTEILWRDSQVGIMVLRSGEMFRTTNRGRGWSRFKDADSVRYPMPISGLRFNPPNPSGFGYRSVLLSDRIIQASTRRRDGERYRLIQWPISLSGVRDETTTGVISISAAPNPAGNRVVIELGQTAKTGAHVTVVDATGRIALRREVEPGERRLDLDLSNLAAGLYRATLNNGGTVSSVPLVVR
jgi:hypothetical protein